MKNIKKLIFAHVRDLNHDALVSVLVDGMLSESGDKFFDRLVSEGYFLDPYSNSFLEEKNFISEVHKKFSPMLDKSENIHNFFHRDFPVWFENYSITGSVVIEIKSELLDLKASQNPPINLLVQVMIAASKKCQELWLAQGKEKNVLDARLKPIVAATNGTATVEESEHVVFDSLNMLIRYLFMKDRGQSLNWDDIIRGVDLEFEELNKFVNFGQLWEGWRDIWNKIRLGFSIIREVDGVKHFLPQNKERFLIEKIGEIRLERSSYEVSMHAMKVLDKDMIDEYDQSVLEMAKLVRSSARDDESWLTSLDSSSLKLLYGKRKHLSTIRRVITDMAFHDSDLKSLMVSKKLGVSAEDLYVQFEYLEILWEIFCEAFGKEKKLDRNSINHLIWFSKENWLELFKGIFKRPELLLEVITFNPQTKSGIDIFCSPLVEVVPNRYITVPYLLGITKISRVIEQHLNASDDAPKNGKILGNSLESAVISVFKDGGYKAASFTRDDIEFDCLGYLSGMYFLIESKRTSTVSSAENSRRALDHIEIGVSQVRKRLSYLFSEKGKRALSSVKEFDGLPPVTEQNIIGIVCTNVLKYSTRSSEDNIVITDLSLLRSYVQNVPYTIEKLDFGDRNFKSKIVSVPRSRGMLSFSETRNYFLNPDPVRLLAERSTERAIPFILQLKPPTPIIIFDFQFEDPGLVRNAESHF